METLSTQALVIGGGPAGLMAAETLAAAGRDVLLVEAKPSLARKFLMAGKSGLNLTKDEPTEQFLSHYHGSCAPLIRDAVRAFDPKAVARWAQDLGQEVFTGSSGRVFPKSMKGSPLLRAWLGGMPPVELRTGWRWAGWEDGAWCFQTPTGSVSVTADATILALGGASWPRLGSDAAWVPWLSARGVDIAPFVAANAGLSVAWSDHMKKHFGRPVKPARLMAGDATVQGEFVISAKGLEGSAIYSVSRPVRDGATLTVDLAPDLSAEEVRARLAKPRGKTSLTNHLRKTLKLDPARIALLLEFARPLPDDLAPVLKALPINHDGLRPLEEAISSAGGIAADALEGYRIIALANTFACGEMLDWEAPTGGYLLTACFATGRAAANQALSSF